MTEQTINGAFSTWTTSGIFGNLSTIIGASLPWASDTAITSAALDLEYHGNRSGDKWVSPAVGKLLNAAATYTGVLTSADITALVNVIWSLNHQRWAKLWASLNFQYNPIENYDSTESIQMAENTTGSDSSTQTPNNWKTTVQGNTSDNESTSNSGVYGFNSSTAVPDRTATNTVKNKQETTQSGTFSTSGSNSNSHTFSQSLTRHGNIGVTTSQQMIQSERELWMWQYFDEIMADIDKVLALSIYK